MLDPGLINSVREMHCHISIFRQLLPGGIARTPHRGEVFSLSLSDPSPSAAVTCLLWRKIRVQIGLGGRDQSPLAVWQRKSQASRFWHKSSPVGWRHKERERGREGRKTRSITADLRILRCGRRHRSSSAKCLQQLGAAAAEEEEEDSSAVNFFSLCV